jgi:hypothetical protein
VKDRHASSLQVKASNNFMMARSSSLVAFLLMAAVSFTSLSAQAGTLTAQTNERPSGCHGHGNRAPAPEPTNYKCCLSGHNIAIPQSSDSPQPAFTSTILEMLVAPPIAESVRALPRILSFSSGGPPGSPLRI